MNITEINTHDIDEILTLFYETVHNVNARDYSQDQLEAWVSKRDINEMRERWIRSFDENFSYKAIAKAKIVGFADMDSSGLLDRLYVHKDYQGQGVASALLNKLEVAARKNDIQDLETFASITAKPFFENKGFQVIFSQKVLKRGVELTNYKMVKKGDTDV
ncbi:GNAT family N-acetyltransferase [Bacillus sp. SG-1]|uniref:GNAT family N-acetyltransferase n=1 Tax=Bacillus sp. SG-1 TaxID=161544 RepID=UPI00015434C5|nr:GNAT family N-acetyltransferase [Bacillus sp. SG-1]EDL66321.1 Acetyltransferase [Bacillus sp. SG-1]